ncbi:ATP-dependent endonuclease [Hephaestia sp. GCM10023244]|uniref:ATP-dependent nuclease n=1 Tax=unclassified Hephaestia TaxID=2631281 RepID=UPI00207758E5|nr:AAA family ATPase [Hephaestia sp. MAHUQ-44]MCM8731815.1 AAA family ATPase [Hephaestia sp. MAHUQ-44]
MRLKRARITNFRSVEDTGEFELDRSTCLVGKNEAGKTAILQALAGLNPHPSTPMTFEKERDYPRRFLADYAERHGDDEAVVVTTVWELDEEQKAKIIELFGEDCLSSDETTISKSYGMDGTSVVVPIDEQRAVANLLSQERLNAAEASAIGQPATAHRLRKVIAAIETPTDKQQRIVTRLDELKGKSIVGAVAAIIRAKLPKFMYFSHYDRMEGQIQLATFSQRLAGQNGNPVMPGERVFVDFLEYAGTSLDEINAATTYEGLNAQCESASNRITEQLLEYWTQNPFLEIDVRVTKGEPNDPAPFNNGIVARARVRNNLHKVTVPFSERSAGFIWFFSFLVKFAQVRKSCSNLFLLLDEPGLTLHGKAQADLLRYFDEKLAPHHQVVFSTHSPFMVPSDDLQSVRTVEDRLVTTKQGRTASEGTKVSGESLAKDPDTLFPLQGALGYDITQTLFIGKNTLLVEGPSDILYLQVLSSELERRGRTKLDLRWTLCPAGGIDKIRSFVGLFSSQNLHVAAMTDFAKGDGNKLKNLEQSGLLENGRLKTFASTLGVEEADVEDIFAPATYAAILKSAFDLKKAEIPTADSLLAADDKTSRLVKKAEAYFRVLSPDTAEFDHFTPSMWLLRNPNMLEAEDAATSETLDRAEKVITAINEMLPDG